MAVSRHTQKDIGSYEAKFIGPFTSKEMMLLTPGILLSGGIGLFLNGLQIFDVITIFIICAIVMAPFVAFAKIEIYGMDLKSFLKMYYKYHILAPPKRLYKTETFDDIVFDVLGNISNITPKEKSKITSETKKNKKTKKRDPEFPSYA